MGDRVTKPRVWDHLAAAGLTVGLVGVPDTFPPRRLSGYSVAGFLAPSTAAAYTWPDALKDEIEEVVGPYRFDVEDFRAGDRDRIYRDICLMTSSTSPLPPPPHDARRRLHDALRDRAGPGPPRLLALRRRDPPPPRARSPLSGHHPRLLPPSRRRGRAAAGRARAPVPRLRGLGPRCPGDGGGLLPQRLAAREGLLVLKDEPHGPTSSTSGSWTSAARAPGPGAATTAASSSNLAGREPQGQGARADYERVLDDLARRLEAVRGPDGRLLGNRVLRPRDLGPAPQGDYPDCSCTRASSPGGPSAHSATPTSSPARRHRPRRRQPRLRGGLHLSRSGGRPRATDGLAPDRRRAHNPPTSSASLRRPTPVGRPIPLGAAE